MVLLYFSKEDMTDQAFANEQNLMKKLPYDKLRDYELDVEDLYAPSDKRSELLALIAERKQNIQNG